MNPLSFDGTLRRVPYALWSLAAFFSQHLFVLAVSAGGTPVLDGWFLPLPFRALVAGHFSSPAMFFFGLAWSLIASWALAALTFRRAADANISEWVAVAAIVPVAQMVAIIVLSVVPSRAQPEAPGAAAVRRQPGWVPTVQGMVAGVAMTLFAVAVGTLGFGEYGFVMFVVSPFLIGAITAYVVNRDEDIGLGNTNGIVAAAVTFGGIALLATALEGLICIVITGPLAIGVAIVGGLLGRSIALSRRRPGTQALSGFVLLPIVYSIEVFLPRASHFDTLQSIQVDAPAEVVWKSILRMETIEEPLALPFRLGVAYPVRGEIIGEGIGAERRGEFSTGIAIERVTEWVPNRKLTFVVIDDIAAMREMSPYGDLRTPHLVGYFRTTTTSFELSPHSGGRTEIVERTSHELKLDPILYWLPLAQWMVAQNNARVLAHIKRQSERSPRTSELMRNSP